MKYYVDQPGKKEQLLEIVDSWAGTPFARFSEAKGRHGGTDCEKYAELVYVEWGVLPAPIDMPRTEKDYNLVAHNTRILDFIRGDADDPRSVAVSALFLEFPLRKVDEFPEEERATIPRPAPPRWFTEPPMIGDLVIGRNETAAVREQGENLWHIGIMIGPRKFTSCTVLGVGPGMIKDTTYNRHFFAHFRPLAID